ncbi:MAG: hypothetical protein AB7I30_21700 [Isosphaeraceae bacterium]
MTVLDSKSLRIQTLQGLIDRLSSPDLTASEANELRPRLFRLLSTFDGPAFPGFADPVDYPETRRSIAR